MTESDPGRLLAYVTKNFLRGSHDWHQLADEDECFFLRVYAPADDRFKGADLGILVTKGRMQTAAGLTERCRQYIDGIRSQYVTEPIEPPRILEHAGTRNWRRWFHRLTSH